VNRNAYRRVLALVFLMALSCTAKPPAERLVLARTREGSLCFYISGSRRTSTPAVVLEAGLGDSSASWRNVAASIAGTTQVVRYDRAGLGCSPANNTPRTATEIAAELHDALSSAQVVPPYVLVSHSAGAWYVSVFAAEYPGEVKGLVLVDPTPPRFFSEISALQNERERSEFASSMAEYEAAATPGRRAEWANRDAAAVETESAKLPNRCR